MFSHCFTRGARRKVIGFSSQALGQGKGDPGEKGDKQFPCCLKKADLV